MPRVRTEGPGGGLDQVEAAAGVRVVGDKDARYKPLDVIQSEPEMKKTAKTSRMIKANKRKAKLKAKHRRQRAQASR